MKQLHSKVTNKSTGGGGNNNNSNNNNTSNSSSVGNSNSSDGNNSNSNNNNSNNNNNTIPINVTNKFRCTVLPEHFTGGIPFVRVNSVYNYDWFVQMPMNIQAGDTFIFDITPNDIQIAQQLLSLQQQSKLSLSEQLAYNTQRANEICQQITITNNNSSNNSNNNDGKPTIQQQIDIIRALHPYVPIITNSVIEGATSTGSSSNNNNNTKNGSISQQQQQQIQLYIQRNMNQIQLYVQQVPYRIYHIGTKSIPYIISDIICDTSRIICIVSGFIISYILGYLLAFAIILITDRMNE